MDKRREELLKLSSYTTGIDNELTLILQSLQWDRKHLLQKPVLVACKYNTNHKVPPDKKEEHENECFLRQNGYTKEDQLLPDPLDAEVNTLIKLGKEDIEQIIGNASRSDPLFKKGVGCHGLEPLSLERLQSSYSSDERRVIHDAVVSAVPSCHDLTDLVLLSGGDDKSSRVILSRMEILVELRNMRRRRTKYRVAAKTRNYSDVLRDVIKTQMEHFSDGKSEAAVNENVEQSNQTDTHNDVRHSRQAYKDDDRRRYDRRSRDFPRPIKVEVKTEREDSSERNRDYSRQRSDRSYRYEERPRDRDRDRDRRRHDDDRHRYERRGREFHRPIVKEEIKTEREDSTERSREESDKTYRYEERRSDSHRYERRGREFHRPIVKVEIKTEREDSTERSGEGSDKGYRYEERRRDRHRERERHRHAERSKEQRDIERIQKHQEQTRKRTSDADSSYEYNHDERATEIESRDKRMSDKKSRTHKHQDVDLECQVEKGYDDVNNQHSRKRSRESRHDKHREKIYEQNSKTVESQHGENRRRDRRRSRERRREQSSSERVYIKQEREDSAPREYRSHYEDHEPRGSRHKSKHRRHDRYYRHSSYDSHSSENTIKQEDYEGYYDRTAETAYDLHKKIKKEK